MKKATFNEKTKVWSGPKVPALYNPDQNLGQLILRVLELSPNAIAQISADTGVSVTCAETRERTLKIAAYLSNLKLRQGDVVGVMAKNSENLAPTTFACLLLGLPVNPITPVMIESDIVQMFSNTQPKLVFCDEENLVKMKNALKTLEINAPVYTIAKSSDSSQTSVAEILNSSALPFDQPAVDSDSVALILCSSGSTGGPKGICKSHREVITHFQLYTARNPIGPSVFFMFTTIFWYSGIYFLVLSTLYGAVRVITVEPPTSAELVRIVNDYKATHLFTGPYAVVDVLETPGLKPFDSVVSWIVTGMPVSKALIEKFSKFIPNGVANGAYGCTELNFFACDYFGEKPGKVGTIVPNMELKIVDEAGNALKNGESGEIYARRSLPFIGYCNNPEKTVEAMDGEWYKTGDLGFFDEDGFLEVTGRKKELLKFNNYHVAPIDLEALINEIEGVVSSCVVGVQEYETGNDIIHAFVIVKEVSKVTEDFVLNYVSERVIDAKKLRGGVHFVDAFPLGFSGKVNRRELAKIAGEKFSQN